MPLLPITSASTLRRCKEWCAEETTPLPLCLICSYPKSGTTWMQAIVAHVLLPQHQLSAHISEYTPFFDADASWAKFDAGAYTANHAAMGFSAWNSHFLPGMLSSLAVARNKIIYVVRPGRDVVTSFFHHLSNQRGAGGDFNKDFATFLQAWCSGEMPYGYWLDHVLAWLAERDARPDQVLLIRYTDLKHSLRECIAEVVAFLGRPISPAVVRALEPALTFSGMQERCAQYQPQSVDWQPGFCFIRAGAEGSEFDPANEAIYQEMLGRRLAMVSPGQVEALRGLHIL